LIRHKDRDKPFNFSVLHFIEIYDLAMYKGVKTSKFS